MDQTHSVKCPPLPLYTCHKQVRAAKIRGVKHGMTCGEYMCTIAFDDGLLVVVPPDWATKHKPEVGGYFVQYEDGYTSFSPAEAFESGYTRVEP